MDSSAEVRETDRERRTNESAEEREASLSRRRLRDRERASLRLVTETAEEREGRLARGRQRARERLATETVDEREARLAIRRVLDVLLNQKKGERLGSNSFGVTRQDE